MLIWEDCSSKHLFCLFRLWIILCVYSHSEVSSTFVVSALVDGVLNISYFSDVVICSLFNHFVNCGTLVNVNKVECVLEKSVDFVLRTWQKHVLTCNGVRDKRFKANVLEPVSLPELLRMDIQGEEFYRFEST
jgi:hypothetical protein